ncbi:ATP synthase F1 subunit gamma [PVC group bacterium (ex Bugula neritina AB1)]|nr:ATP synthase F1 subunit gamma [PVC group bacterium (ex Bugula neritina AB1)]
MTRAMQMISSVKFRKFDKTFQKVKPSAKVMAHVVEDVAQRNRGLANPFLRKTKMDKQKDLVVIITGDRGLCGNYNSAVIREATALLKKSDYDIGVIGKRGQMFFEGLGKSSEFFFENPGAISFGSFVQEVSEVVLQRYASYDRVFFLYTEFVNTLTRKVSLKKIFPVCEGECEGKKAETLYEMDEKEVLDQLVEEYLFSSVTYAVSSAAVSEESARMAAMDSATHNAEEMISSLNLIYNRVRQAAITKEMIEISSGSEALVNV